MKTKITLGLCLVLASLVFLFPQALLAQEEKIELTTPYTKLESTSGATFEFDVTLKYQGSQPRNFTLSVSGPSNWTTYITPTYPKDKRIQDIWLEPNMTTGNKITVYASPPVWLNPEPGEYQVVVEAASGELRDSLTLTVIITARYDMSLTTPDGRLSTKATAGKDNYFTIVVQNTGTAPIENITFSSSKPTGWTVQFSPEKIDSLPADSSRTIDVNIKPGAKTIAGDYQLSISANGKQRVSHVDIRVTVETPTIWGWIGVVIIVLVIAGLVFVFIRFSRR